MNLGESISAMSAMKRLAVVIFFLLLILGLIVKVSKNRGYSEGPQQAVFPDKATKSKAQVKIGQSFEFKAINAKKEEVSVIFTLVSAERKDEIRGKDEPRHASPGRDYLLLRLEIQNNKAERVAIASSDRIRLEGEDGKLFSPDYHNGNVVVDPISVRRDSVVFVVDSNINNFSFLVGIN